MSKLDAVREALENMTDSGLLFVHREYCDQVNAYDDTIYSMDEFNEIMSGQDADWIANRIYYGDYNPTADYFRFNGYGNIESVFSFQLSEYIDTDTIAEWITEHENALYNDEIQEILDEFEEDAD